jgi:hypothetical protein
MVHPELRINYEIHWLSLYLKRVTHKKSKFTGYPEVYRDYPQSLQVNVG